MAKDLKEQIEIMTHYLNGGEVEICKNNKWSDITNPEFKDWNFAIYGFRIKEQKNTITIEKWLCEYIRSKHLEGSNRFFILEKAVPFEVHGEKIKLIEKYEVEL